jgi:nucleotidyltransferase/DNA polymerase involved in DNA repair
MASSSTSRVVLHVDADAFFCQVHRLAIDPSLNVNSSSSSNAVAASAAAANTPATTAHHPPPLAVQQEGGIIAADHSARALGVQKWMDSRQAERLLRPKGGRVVAVFADPSSQSAGAAVGGGGRVVSYRPYREMSSAMVRVLREVVAGVGGGLVERASIDEAFVELGGAATAAAGAELAERVREAAIVEVEAATATAATMQQGAELAQRVRESARTRLGLVLSVGVARNRLLAKLGSRAAKPDGVFVVASAEDESRLLEATPAEKLPGMGGEVAKALKRMRAREAAAGAMQRGGDDDDTNPPPQPLETAADLDRRFGGDAAALAAASGLDLPTAARLAAYCRGEGGNGAPTAPAAPRCPASLGAQHTLTPITVLARMLPGALSGEGCGPGGDVRPLLPPLPPRGTEEWRREEERLRQQWERKAAAAAPSDPLLPAWAGPRVGNYLLLRHGAPGASHRLRRLLELMCFDVCSRLMLERREDEEEEEDEGRRRRQQQSAIWPRKLRVNVAALDPALSARVAGGKSAWGPCIGHASRSGGDFPPMRLLGAAAATAAAAAPAAATGSASGERSVPVPPALLAATTDAAFALVDGLLSSRVHYGCPVIAVSVTAAGIEGGDGGGGGKSGGGGSTTHDRSRRRQTELERYFRPAAGAKREREQSSSDGGGGLSKEELSSEEESEEEQLRLSSLPTPPSPPAAAAAAAAAVAPPPPAPAPLIRQAVTLLRLPLVEPVVLRPDDGKGGTEAEDGSAPPSSSSPSPSPCDVHTAVALRAAPPRAAAPVPARPPPLTSAPTVGVRITDVLASLAAAAKGGGGTASSAAAAAALDAALARAGARRALLPLSPPPPSL